MNGDLQTGDVVELNSGGVPMTIEQFIKVTGGENKADCVWMVEGKFQRERLPIAALKIINKESGPNEDSK